MSPGNLKLSSLMLCSWDFQIGFTREEMNILCGRVSQIFGLPDGRSVISIDCQIFFFFAFLSDGRIIPPAPFVVRWSYMTCSGPQALS